jgi:tetratricopeptide (TPR) repeat protein
MKKVFSFQFSVCSVLIVSIGNAADPLPLSSAYWRDPAFQKAFNGSYRIEARIEPSITTEERGLLVEVQSLMEKGQREQALDKIKSSALTAKSTALTFNLANLQFEEGQLDEAIAAYQKAVGAYPSFRRAHRNLAVALVRKNELEKALPHLLDAIRLGDSEGATYGLLGYCRLQRGEWASALQAYRLAQISEPDAVDWKAGIAQCLQNLNSRDEAVALLDEVIRKRPLESSYAVLQAGILLDLDRTTDAVKALELPRRLNTLDADGLLLLAELHLREQRRDAVTDIIAEAFAKEEKPGSARITSLVSTAISRKDWPLAKELLEKSGPLTEQTPPPLRLAAARLKIESKDAPEAGAEILADLIRLDPTDGAALLALGKYHAATGKSGEAELLLERATTEATTATEAWIELARLHVDARRYPEALKAIDEALALESSDDLQAYRAALAELAEAAR